MSAEPSTVEVRLRVSLPQAASLRQALSDLLGALDTVAADDAVSVPAATSPPLQLTCAASKAAQPCGLVHSDRASQSPRDSLATAGAAQPSTPQRPPAAQAGMPADDSSEIAAKLNALREAAHFGHTRSYQQAAPSAGELID